MMRRRRKRLTAPKDSHAVPLPGRERPRAARATTAELSLMVVRRALRHPRNAANIGFSEQRTVEA
jgi:hypothetical protein